MKKTLFAFFAAWLGCSTVWAQVFDSYEIDFANASAPALTAYRGNVRGVEFRLRNGTNAVDLAQSAPYAWWAENDRASAIVTASVEIVSATGGVFRAVWSGASMNPAIPGAKIYGVGVTDGGLNTFKIGTLNVLRDPNGSGATNMPPNYVTNWNWNLINWTGLPSWATEAWVTNWFAEHGGTADLEARGGVESNTAAIAVTTSNLTAHTSNTSNPHSVTAAQIGAASQADLDLLSAADVPVGCAGGFWNEDYFTMETVPYAYTATSIGSTSQVNSILAAPRVYTGENGLLLQPTIVRQSSYTNELIYGDAVNFTLIETNGHDVAEWTEGATNGTVGTLTATLGEFSRTVTGTHEAGADITNWWWVADVAGSLRALVNTAMLARAAQTGMSQYVYAAGAYSATNFERSTNCWAYGVDLTSASPWNSLGAQFYAGTAITPQHVLLATHWPRSGIPAGTVFRFIDATNGLHLATAADRRDLSDDLTVVRLAAALPDAIVPAKVLGATDKGYFLGKENLFGDPGYRLVYLDQGERAWIANDIIATEGLFWDETAYIRGEDSPFGQEEAVGGDSGNPVFLVIGTNTVLYTIFRSSVTGPSIAAHAEEIEAALAAMGGSVHTNLSYVPMNTFTNYDVPAVP